MVSRPRWRRPVEGRLEERPGDLQVVHGIEEVELGFFGLVVLVEEFVLAGANAPDHLAVPKSQEEIRLGMLEEGMLLAVQRQVGVHEERRHPLRTVLVEFVIEFNELLDLLLVLVSTFSMVSMPVSWDGNKCWYLVYNTYSFYGCDDENGKNAPRSRKAGPGKVYSAQGKTKFFSPRSPRALR